MDTENKEFTLNVQSERPTVKDQFIAGVIAAAATVLVTTAITLVINGVQTGVAIRRQKREAKLAETSESNSNE